jgi:hypothetical protein
VDVTIRAQPAPPEDIVAEGDRKGYDMLLIGLERTASGPNMFDARLSRVAVNFGGPVAVMRASSKHVVRPAEGKLNILVPVNGTGVSRRGAEIALTPARASNAKCTGLIVAAEPEPRAEAVAAMGGAPRRNRDPRGTPWSSPIASTPASR